MRPRSLLVLLAVVVALAAFIWFFERDLPGTEEREEMAKLVLPRLDAGEVTAVAVEHGGEAVRIERVEAAEEDPAAGEEEDGEAGEGLPADLPPPAEWRITAPERFAGARADRVAVDSLLSALAALEKSRTLEELDRAALGLEAPRARLTLEREDGGAIMLAVGADLPASSDMVVLREDRGEAYVVDRAVLQDLTRAPGDWRAREMFPGERGDVERVRLAGGGGEVVLARAGDGSGFRVAAPFEDAADAEKVDELLTALTRLSAERFVDAPDAAPAELGLAPPAATVTVELAGGRPPVAVEIGAPRPEGDGHTYRVGGQLFVAESALPEAAARPAAAWRSPALTSIELYRVDRVTIDGPGAGGRLELTRSGTDWQRGGETIGYTPVSDLLFALVEARAAEIVPRAAAPSGAPEITVELAAGGEEGEEPERATISFHPAAEGLVPVTVSGRAVVLRVPEETVAGLRGHLARVRAAEPAAAADGETVPEGIEVEREEGF